jgi:hypothetical protein
MGKNDEDTSSDQIQAKIHSGDGNRMLAGVLDNRSFKIMTVGIESLFPKYVSAHRTESFVSVIHRLAANLC